MDTLKDQLVTGIPNEITLLEIVPKLPRRYGKLLRELSKTWHSAYRSGLVDDARVCSQATEKFLLFVSEFQPGIDLPPTYLIHLYSRSGDSWYKLPLIPGFPAGLPYNCQYMPLNGKLYVLGGSKTPLSRIGMREVYVLDLAGQEWQWKQCQSMQVPRRWPFIVESMNVKIFVSGLHYRYGRTNRSEKYDPQVDVWSEIQPNITYILHYALLHVGNECFLFHHDMDGLANNLLVDHPDFTGDDEAEDPFVNEGDDPSDDEVEDPFISEPGSSDELHDGTWITMIDPDLFRDDDCPWFREINKHGFHQILEQKGLHNFDETIENEGLGGWPDLENASSYVAYDVVEDKWREVKNLSKDDLNRILLMAQPMPEMSTPASSLVFELSPNYTPFVRADIWPLNF